MLGACVFSLCVNHSSQDSKQVKIMCFDIKSMFSLYLLTIPVSAQNRKEIVLLIIGPRLKLCRSLKETYTIEMVLLGWWVNKLVYPTLMVYVVFCNLGQS